MSFHEELYLKSMKQYKKETEVLWMDGETEIEISSILP